MFPPCIFVISPKCSMSGKWRFVMAIGDFSISLAQTGIIPLREAARGNTPIPSNRLPNLRAHIDRLSFCFFMCCFHFSAPFQTIKNTINGSPFNGVCCCLLISQGKAESPIEKDANLKMRLFPSSYSFFIKAPSACCLQSLDFTGFLLPSLSKPC